jgi:hypothetical protein
MKKMTFDDEEDVSVVVVGLQTDHNLSTTKTERRKGRNWS